jgi:hypothetical protein
MVSPLPADSGLETSMSVPNTSNDAAAPLLVGDPSQDGTDDEPSLGKHITIFKRTFNVMHLVFFGVGTLALVAIGVSIAAIGTKFSERDPDDSSFC